jgi:DNA modification methylase
MGGTSLTSTILHGNCLDHMKLMEPNSVDAIVTDPPYGLKFMGKEWDHGVPGVPFWIEALRVLKPGGHMVAFGGTRTVHRLTVAIEDAGFSIRDTLIWMYGSGFPKGQDFACDREATRQAGHRIPKPEFIGTPFEQGWNVALKPAHEPIVLARKPLGASTIAGNVLAWGTGAINVDACRIEGVPPKPTTAPGWDSINQKNADGGYRPGAYQQGGAMYEPHTAGRWPPNVLMDETAAAELDAMSGERKSGGGDKHGRKASTFCASTNWEQFKGTSAGGDTGGASRFMAVVPAPIDDPDAEHTRFMYCAKASRRERNAGLDGMPERETRPLSISNWSGQTNGSGKTMGPSAPQSNTHATVKPIALMRWLCKLICPSQGLVYDPFMGSGTTGCATVQEGFHFIGSELDKEFCEIAARRIAYWEDQAHAK